MNMRDQRNNPLPVLAALGLGLALLLAAPVIYFNFFMFVVPSRHMAVLTKKTGKDLPIDQEIAPDASFKGVQAEVKGEGRHALNPWDWAWQIVEQVEIPEGKLGVRVRLYGEDLPYGEVIARNENQKGILPDVLRSGRYPLNAWVKGTSRRDRDSYAEYIELHDPVVIPGGFKGVVTDLAGPMPQEPNQLLVPAGFRGAQEETLPPGTYYLNPYVTQVYLVDCRSQRFNLSDGGEMGFPSKDGFWVTLDGVIEFRVMPEKAAQVFVAYNDTANDSGNDARIDEEIVNAVILPNARSFCRLRGSDHSGKDFISGDTRTKFQQDFQAEIKATCESQGIEIIQALLTRINPPQKIADPVRRRQIAVQQAGQFEREILQQQSEQELATEREMVKRKQAIVAADQQVVKLVTDAARGQEVALIGANQRLKVAEFELRAAEDLAAAVTAKGKAEAEVIRFNNEAEAAGWKKAVEAFGGSGDRYARWVLLNKLAPSFRSMMVNTADSPLMEIFRQYEDATPSPPRSASTAPAPVDREAPRPVVIPEEAP